MMLGCEYVLAILLKLVIAITAVEITPYRETDYKTECYGSHNQLSLIGDHVQHYQSIRSKYSGCTYVHGNLEITHLNDPDIDYDLDFLSDIEVVTGYVFIAVVNNALIPLTSLKLIKAERPMRYRGGYYGLYVLGTKIEELQLPALREISNGDVMFLVNPSLCYINTIRWEEVTTNNVNIIKSGMSQQCGQCAANCVDEYGNPHCWGSGYTMCQTVHHLQCYEDCFGSPKLCHAEGMLGCCHPQCAVGCFGGLDTQCLMCRHYKYGHKCVETCPQKAYAYAGYCVDYYD